jgi:hypothetical protein
MKKITLLYLFVIFGICDASSQDSLSHASITSHRGACFTGEYTWQGTNFGGGGLCYYKGKSVNYGFSGWKIDADVDYGKRINPIWTGKLSVSIFELFGELRVAFKEFRSEGIIDYRITPEIYYSVIGVVGFGFGYNIPLAAQRVNGITGFEFNFYVTPPIGSKFRLWQKLKYLTKMRML